jgi:hypothetical protein
MKVLLACEESQAVTKELRRLGHDAYSCDIMPCSGGHPEWHIQDDVLTVLGMPWDMMIAFPPCTHLASSGARWWKQKQEDGRQQAAIGFFMALAKADIPKIAIENPVGIMSTVWRKPDQIIQPWMFGHPESKATCLWLKGLGPLMLGPIVAKPTRGYWDNQTPSGQNKLGPSPDRAMIRSKTYAGIARAMATQWSSFGAHI